MSSDKIEQKIESILSDKEVEKVINRIRLMKNEIDSLRNMNGILLEQCEKYKQELEDLKKRIINNTDCICGTLECNECPR